MPHLITSFDTRDRTGTFEVHTNGIVKIGTFDSINNTASLGEQDYAISMPLTTAENIIFGLQTYVLNVMRNVWNWPLQIKSSHGVKIEFEHKPGESSLTTAVYGDDLKWNNISKYEINLTSREFTFLAAPAVVLGMAQYLYHDDILTEWVKWANTPNKPFIFE